MATSTTTDSVPELVDGERLDSAEFERRYHASSIRKAELIEGVVRVASPVTDDHSPAHGSATLWVGLYQIGTPHLIMGVEGTVRLDQSNQPQPDVHLRIAPGFGGGATRSADGYVEGPPELIVEVAVTSTRLDLGDKLEAYRRNGVPEYIVWRVRDRAIDWFRLRDGRYERLVPGDDGLIRSVVFAGLWLDPAALIRGDLPALNAAVLAGLATEEHAAFVARLAGAQQQQN